MRSVTALALVLALCLAFVAPSAMKAESRSRVTQAEGGDFLPAVWRLFLRQWRPESMRKEGCRIDPLGGGCQKAAPTSEAGCGIDPLGGCQATDATTDEGMTIDPLG